MPFHLLLPTSIVSAFPHTGLLDTRISHQEAPDKFDGMSRSKIIDRRECVQHPLRRERIERLEALVPSTISSGIRGALSRPGDQGKY